MSTSYKIEIVPHDPHWAIRFAELRTKLVELLRGESVRVEHVGSTSVEGLAAKPVLDVDIVIPDQGDFDKIRKLLEEGGYEYRGNLGVEGREAFRISEIDETMRHNLYVLRETADELKRHVGFRDWLRSHPEDREAYDRVKREAAETHSDDIEAYIDAKSGIILEIYQKAGLFNPEDLQEAARTVLVNRYGLGLRQLTCGEPSAGVYSCQVVAQEGTFCLLAKPEASSTTEAWQISSRDPVLQGLIRTAKGDAIAKEQFFAFALFQSAEDARNFVASGGYDAIKSR